MAKFKRGRVGRRRCRLRTIRPITWWPSWTITRFSSMASGKTLWRARRWRISGGERGNDHGSGDRDGKRHGLLAEREQTKFKRGGARAQRDEADVGGVIQRPPVRKPGGHPRGERCEQAPPPVSRESAGTGV